MDKTKAVRPVKVPRKKPVPPPLSEEDKKLFQDKPGRVRGPNIKAEKITTVGLGGLKVTTNGRINY